MDKETKKKVILLGAIIGVAVIVCIVFLVARKPKEPASETAVEYAGVPGIPMGGKAGEAAETPPEGGATATTSTGAMGPMMGPMGQMSGMPGMMMYGAAGTTGTAAPAAAPAEKPVKKKKGKSKEPSRPDPFVPIVKGKEVSRPGERPGERPRLVSIRLGAMLAGPRAEKKPTLPEVTPPTFQEMPRIVERGAPIVLAGVLINGKERWAAIETRDGQKQVVKEGDKIGDEYTLEKVSENMVTLKDSKGETTEVPIKKPGETTFAPRMGMPGMMPEAGMMPQMPPMMRGTRGSIGSMMPSGPGGQPGMGMPGMMPGGMGSMMPGRGMGGMRPGGTATEEQKPAE